MKKCLHPLFPALSSEVGEEFLVYDMNYGFWGKLEKPFFALAPMANVTDTVFRQIIVKYGRPDVLWTEFVPTDGLCSEGREAVLRDLQYLPTEHPIVAQIFGSTPAHFYETARLVAELGFDGVDINMGCPEKNIVKSGACSALINEPSLAQDIIFATKEGAGDMPVSVKTRLGFSKDILEEWLPVLLETKIAAITVHGRTRKEMSLHPAKWNRIKDAADMARDTGTLIIGNGDVESLEDARKKAKETGVDGVMMGRAIFGNPWLFNKEGKIPTLPEKLRAMVEHTQLFEQTWGDTKSFELMKKHYKAYVNGFDGAKFLRMKLMECHNAAAIEKKLEEFLDTNPSLSQRS
ncbi:MAG: tRNA-dihydrouridine synthase [Candidatus Moranbacteria bacterium]|nr:tRNA-dihydrouridine synthase [Candidatus Moranbacteria bacterium]